MTGEELKLNFINEYANPDEYTTIDIMGKLLRSLSSDEEKLKYIPILKGDARISLIASLSSDEKKIELLEPAGPSRWTNKGIIIASLSSEEKKLELLESLELSDDDKGRIVASLSSEEKKLEFLRESKINGGHYRHWVVQSLSADENKLEFIDSITRDFDKANILGSLNGDEKKLESLDAVPVELRYLIIKTLSNDDQKIELLETVPVQSRVHIILSLTSDDKKLELLETVPEENRSSIVAELSSDDKKLIILETLDKSSRDAEIITASLSDDRKKLELLESMPKYGTFEKIHRRQMVESLKSNQTKLHFLEEFKSLSDKVSILDTIPNDAQIEPIVSKQQNHSTEQQMQEALRTGDYRTYMSLFDNLSPEEKINAIIDVQNGYRAEKSARTPLAQREANLRQEEQISSMIGDVEKEIDEPGQDIED